MLPRCRTTAGALHPLGEFEGLERIAQGHLPLAGTLGGELVNIGRGMGDPNGQRAEVMQAGNLDLPRFDGLDNARHQADASAVAQLGVFKTQFPDFPQHRAAIRVPVGIPTGGKRIHNLSNMDHSPRSRQPSWLRSPLVRQKRLFSLGPLSTGKLTPMEPATDGGRPSPSRRARPTRLH